MTRQEDTRGVHTPSALLDKMAATTATLLTVETVPAYLDARAAEIGVFPPGAALECSAIVGGNVNFAFHVKEPSTGKALFVKQVQQESHV